MNLKRLLPLAMAALLAACATGVREMPETGAKSLAFQNVALNPLNGGQLVGAADLKPGDIILSSDNGLNSIGIRLLTQSPVSHALVYMGSGEVAEAVGDGVRRRTMEAVLKEESTVVAFRHPGVRAEHMEKMAAFVERHVGRKYNFMGVMLQAPFTVERKLCELPLVPGPVRDFCLQGVAAVQLGLGRNDRFFCSQFVLEAYREAGLPLTPANPLLVSPRDLMHMREGDVPSVRIHQALQYVGHLKFQPPQAVSATNVHGEQRAAGQAAVAGAQGG